MATRRMTSIDIDANNELDAVLRTFILFTQTALEVLKYVAAYLHREAGFSTIHLVVLQVMDRNGSMMTPSEIDEWTQTEHHNVTTLIRRMKKAGLVTSERSQRNRKIVNVTLTDKGREILAQLLPVARQIVDRVMYSIDEDDAAWLDKLLRLIRQNAHFGLEGINIRVIDRCPPRPVYS